MRRSFLIVLLAGLSGSLVAQQDIQFSQFYTAPMFLNPAATAAYHGDFSAYTNYRTQWRSFTGAPFRTITAAFDAPIRPTKGGNYFGAGATFFNDKTGDVFSSSTFSLNGSYVMELGRHSYMSVGIGIGLLQRSIEFTDLYWDNQWNGQTFDQSISSGEVGFTDRFMTLDMSGGAYFFSKNDDGFGGFAGIGIKHFNQPNVTFIGQNEKLDMKFIMHAGMEIPFPNPSFRLVPNAIGFMQGPHTVINFGTELKYMLSTASHSTNFINDNSISLGTYYRWADATYIAARLNLGGLAFGMAYDITVSDLKNYNGGSGGVEIFISYIANFGNTAGISNFR